jgi:hypothetical protein
MTKEGSKAIPHNPPDDQVVRRNIFSQAHPEVTFEFRRETGRWESTYPTGGNGAQTVHGSELKDVLDKLDEHFGQPGLESSDGAR